MKYFGLLLLVGTAFGVNPPPERILIEKDISRIQPMLDQGWTVKHLSTIIKMSGTDNRYAMVESSVVVVLEAPVDFEQREEARRIEAKRIFDKKREDYLKALPKPEKK